MSTLTRFAAPLVAAAPGTTIWMGRTTPTDADAIVVTPKTPIA